MDTKTRLWYLHTSLSAIADDVLCRGRPRRLLGLWSIFILVVSITQCLGSQIGIIETKCTYSHNTNETVYNIHQLLILLDNFISFRFDIKFLNTRLVVLLLSVTVILYFTILIYLLYISGNAHNGKKKYYYINRFYYISTYFTFCFLSRFHAISKPKGSKSFFFFRKSTFWCT